MRQHNIFHKLFNSGHFVNDKSTYLKIGFDAGIRPNCDRKCSFIFASLCSTCIAINKQFLNDKGFEMET